MRAWQDTDIAAFNAVPSEPTLATAQHWIAGDEDRFARRLSIDLVIVTEADLVIGEVGLAGFSDKHQGALIGYWLLPEARGQGLAAGAVGAVTAWAHATLALEIVVAKCHPDNAASHRVAAKSGYRHETNDSSGYQLWRSHARGV